MSWINRTHAPHSSLESFDFVEMPRYCPENYKLYNGRCFGVHENPLNFSDAEAECSKLPGGHLAAFRSQDELDFIRNLSVNLPLFWQNTFNNRHIYVGNGILIELQLLTSSLIYCNASQSQTSIVLMWVGLTDEGDEGNWTFTDGTTLPEGVTLNVQNGASNENCGFLYLGIDDYKCWKKIPYLCMAKGNCP